MTSMAHTNGRGSKQALVRDELLGMLDELQVGDAMPSERRLASDLGVSRPTLRAVDRRARARGPARCAATAAAPTSREPKIALPLTMTSFSEDMARRGMRPSSQVVSFERQSAGRQARPAPADLARRRGLGDHPPAPRRRRDDGDRVAARAARARCPSCAARTSTGTPSTSCCASGTGIVIASGIQTIEPTVTSRRGGGVLGVPVHSPAFLFERTTRERARGGGGVRAVRVPRGPVPAGDGAAPGAEIAPARRGPAARRRPARYVVRRPLRTGDASNHTRREGGTRRTDEEVQRGGRGRWCSRSSWPRCGGARRQADRRAAPPPAASSRARSASGSWIRARRRSRASSSSTGPTSRPPIPGTKVNIQFVPWAQAHDKFVTAIAGGKVPDVAEMGTTWTPEFADQGGLVEQPEDRQGRLRLQPGRRRDARRQGLRQAVVRGRARADLPQGHAREGRRREPPKTWDEMMAAAKAIKAKVAGRLPGLLHRPERAHVPADDLAGGRADRHPGRRHVEVGAEHAARRRRRIDYYTSFYKDGLDPEGRGRLGGAGRADRVHQRRRGDADRAAAGPTTRSSPTKPELEKKIGTELDAGRPVAARTRRSRAAATSCSSRSPRTRTSAPRSSTSCSSPRS